MLCAPAETPGHCRCDRDSPLPSGPFLRCACPRSASGWPTFGFLALSVPSQRTSELLQACPLARVLLRSARLFPQPIHCPGSCSQAAREAAGSQLSLWTPAPTSALPGLFLRRMWFLLRVCLWSCQAAHPPGARAPSLCLPESLLSGMPGPSVWPPHLCCVVHDILCSTEPVRPSSLALPGQLDMPIRPWWLRARHRAAPSALPSTGLCTQPSSLPFSLAHTHTPSGVFLPSGHAPDHHT